MTTRHLALLAALLAAAACGDAAVDGAPTAPPGANNTATNEDVDAPLEDLDALLGGAPDNDALPSEGKADATYPRQFDLVAKQSPVKSQASRGVCSIFSTVALMEHLYISAGYQGTPDFSEQYLQWSVKNEVGAFPATGGSNPDENLRAISRFGIVEEGAWRYETSPWNASNDAACVGGENLPIKCYTNGEPPESARSASKFKLPAGRYIKATADSIKAHLSTRKTAVAISGTFFYQGWNHRGSPLPTNQDYFRAGYVLAPNTTDETESLKKRAGHSVVIVGWDDDLQVQKVDGTGKAIVTAAGDPSYEKGFFLFKNSWGKGSFGVNNPKGDGYGWISYAYVAKHMSASVSDLPTIAAAVVPEICGNGIDDDGANGADCLDPACSADASCGATDGRSTNTESPEKAIPDNSTTGATVETTVAEGGPVTNVTVTLDIEHTYRGDLTVKLKKGRKTKTLVANQGGGEDHLKASFETAHFDGVDAAGVWKLQVIDNAAGDTGTIKSWTLEIAR